MGPYFFTLYCGSMIKIPLTLVMIERNGLLLLGMKKRGFGAGRWNGFGGKIEGDETIEQAARRELFEEVGLAAEELQKRGVLTFSFESDPLVLEVHIFSVTDFLGEPVETEEMRPEWFLPADIPFSDMWPDDEHWVPLFLAGKCFSGQFHFDAPASPSHVASILSFEIEEVEAA